ncbi:nuclear fragile X mental retardation-interacting protein 2-like [Rhinatrema bivittatum]|uniref:nuclear fragile X mental retardation-interacting protein 2-like n=1 Tax=Rhinatrema bivittatum TaxID=194408 RepID=UPI00112EB825|nr:nuclear fragile X mental retardation-interacting protein 2-like [Rhinatrema bivittatum]
MAFGKVEALKKRAQKLRWEERKWLQALHVWRGPPDDISSTSEEEEEGGRPAAPPHHHLHHLPCRQWRRPYHHNHWKKHHHFHLYHHLGKPKVWYCHTHVVQFLLLLCPWRLRRSSSLTTRKGSPEKQHLQLNSSERQTQHPRKGHGRKACLLPSRYTLILCWLYRSS